jgi:tetratricopeptide (TPR) repeat protein
MHLLGSARKVAIQIARVSAVASRRQRSYEKYMSDDSSDPAQQKGFPSHTPAPQFKAEFEKVITFCAEATLAGKTEEAHLAGLQALAMCAGEQLRNPDPCVSLMNEADDLEGKGDWAAAEAVRRKVLALTESSDNFGMIAKAQMELANLLRLVGRLDEAWEFACAATISTRQNPSVLVMTLLCEAACALERGDSTKALAAASEAVQANKPGKLHDHMRARSLTTRAKCLLAQDDLAGAGSDLDLACELLGTNHGSWIPPGILWTLGLWWEAKSQLEERLRNLPRAREAIIRAIENRRQSVSPHGLAALARTLEKLGEISKVAGDLEGAKQALSEAESIREGLHLPMR